LGRPCSPLFPYTTLFRSNLTLVGDRKNFDRKPFVVGFSYTFLILLAFCLGRIYSKPDSTLEFKWITGGLVLISAYVSFEANHFRSEEHTSELQSRENLVC